MIECKCGCGTCIDPLDKKGRPKSYVHGHAGRKERIVCICKCGCGEEFTKIEGSTKIYIRNHQNSKIGFQKGYIPWNKGKDWTPPNIQSFIDGGKKTRYKPGQITGENHHMWKGGITSESHAIRTSTAYKQWRQAVFERDDYTCQICGTKGGNLIADHIKAFYKYPELRLEVSNGRTLCDGCNYQSTIILQEWKRS